MAVDKKFFVDINLQGNALNNATIGSNSDMTKGGSFRFDGSRLEYYDGSSTQSVANLADIAAVTGGLILQGGYDAATNTPDIADGNASKGFFWVVTTAGSFLGESVQVGDSIIAKVDNAGASIGDWLILQGNVVIATDSVDGIVRLATQAEVDGGTEGGAVVVTPATLQSKIESQITPAIDSKLPLAGGTMSGSIDMDGNDINNVNVVSSSTIAADAIQSLSSDSIFLGGDLDAHNGNKIINLPTPINSGDAANMLYVDDQSAAAEIAAVATASADATSKANAAQSAAESYADSLAPNYDAAGSATTAENNAKAYADSLAPNYDPAGSAATAESNANSYTDGAIAQEVIDRDAAIATAKSEAIADANTYTDNQIAAQTFSSSYSDTNWTLEAAGHYTLTVTHNIYTLTPKVSTVLNGGGMVEFYVKVDSEYVIVLVSNIAPPALVMVGVSK